MDTTDACTWRPTTDTPWITITPATERRGPGRVTYSVAANTGTARRGTIVVGGQTFEIDQDGATACVFAVSPPSLNVGASGGSGGPLSVATANGCSWTAVSHAPWITVTSGNARTGSGTVSISVAPKTGTARSGSVTGSATIDATGGAGTQSPWPPLPDAPGPRRAMRRGSQLLAVRVAPANVPMRWAPVLAAIVNATLPIPLPDAPP